MRRSMRRSAVCIGLQRAHLIGAERRAVERARLAALLHQQGEDLE